MVGGVVSLERNNPMFSEGQSANNPTLNRGAKIGLWGSAISTLGDALQTIGAAISIEEGLISDAEQQRELDNLQSQIDELKKEQSQNIISVDVEMLDKLVEKFIDRLDEVTKDNADKS